MLRQKILIAIIASSYMVLTACTPGISDIYQQVIDDSVAQYEIVKRQGAAMDRCVHAGIVAAAYLQAQDEVNFANWKRQERIDCSAAEAEFMVF